MTFSIYTKKHEMYMANTKVLRLVPNTTYIPLTRVGGFASPNARDTNMLVLFALGNAKVLSLVLGDAKVFFFLFSQKKFFLLFSPVHSSL